MLALPAELLREAMDGAREGGEGALAALQSAIATSETAEGVDGGVGGAMLQDAKTLLATQPLRKAMERREVVGLRAAIDVAEGNVDVDGAVVKVSGCWTRARTVQAAHVRLSHIGHDCWVLHSHL